MKIRCIIVDDEPPAVDELKYILSQIKDIEVVASAGSASEAVTAIKESKPDVVFLDIHMPRHSGFYVAEKVSRFDPPPLIIFATAYDQYAVQAFEEGSLDYILKPFSEKRIQKALIRARNVLTSKIKIVDENDLKRLLNVIEGTKQSINRLPVEKKGHVLLMDPSYIFFFKAEDWLVPPLTIQPLVENAVKHGLAGREEGGHVRITVSRSDSKLHVLVQDDGVGMDPEHVEKMLSTNGLEDSTGGIGLNNINQRLERIYGPQYKIKIDSRPEQGTCVHLIVPDKSTIKQCQHQKESSS